MKRILTLYLVLICFLFLGISTLTFANGRSPGIRTEDLPIKATCIDITDFKHELSYVTIFYKEESNKFLIVRKGVAEGRIPLARIERLEFKRENITGDFLKTDVLMRNGPTETHFIKVKEEGKDINLIGFEDRGGRIEIPLSKCKKIAFSILGSSSDTNGRPYSPEMEETED